MAKRKLNGKGHRALLLPSNKRLCRQIAVSAQSISENQSNPLLQLPSEVRRLMLICVFQDVTLHVDRVWIGPGREPNGRQFLRFPDVNDSKRPKRGERYFLIRTCLEWEKCGTFARSYAQQVQGVQWVAQEPRDHAHDRTFGRGCHLCYNYWNVRGYARKMLLKSEPERMSATQRLLSVARACRQLFGESLEVILRCSWLLFEDPSDISRFWKVVVKRMPTIVHPSSGFSIAKLNRVCINLTIEGIDDCRQFCRKLLDAGVTCSDLILRVYARASPLSAAGDDTIQGWNLRQCLGEETVLAMRYGLANTAFVSLLEPFEDRFGCKIVSTSKGKRRDSQGYRAALARRSGPVEAARLDATEQL